MSYLDTTAFLSDSYIKTSTITQSAITESTLDMNMKNITSVKDPIDRQDAATKGFVEDQLASIVQTQTVQLNGQAFAEVINLTHGAFTLIVQSTFEGGPVGQFTCMKISDATIGTINANAIKTPTGEQLIVTWPANSAILIRKSGDNFDGLYRVRIF